MIRTLLTLILVGAGVMTLYAADTASRIRQALRPYASDPGIGVAVILAEGDTVGVNADTRFNLESVMKFYQAVALSHILGNRVFTDSVQIVASDLHADTWSPLRARYPEGGICVTPVFLLDYTLQMSDNNAADILFDRYGSPELIDSIVRKVSRAGDFSLHSTEAMMHADTTLCRLNRASPADAATLIFDYFCLDSLSVGLRAVMSRPTAFGNNRLVAGLPQGKATILHKTGTGFNAPGHTGNVNDVGFVYYPRADGSFGYYAIAVFIADREGAAADAEALIARISEDVWAAHVAADADYALSGTVPAGKRWPNVVIAGDDEGLPWFAAVTSALLEAVIDQALGTDGY